MTYIAHSVSGSHGNRPIHRQLNLPLNLNSKLNWWISETSLNPYRQPQNR